MKPFLKIVAEQLHQKNDGDFSNLTLVLPSKRSSLYFKKYLIDIVNEKELDTPIWLPKMHTIDEFISGHSEKSVPHTFELILILFKCFKKLDPDTEIDLDKFFPFGEMLLKDFEEIDNYRIDIDGLFFNLDALEKIKKSELLHLVNDYKAVEEFVKHFQESSDSEVKTRFQLLWNKVCGIYHLFNKELEKESLAYNGILSRELSDNIKSGKITFSENEMISFVGFNALTNSESMIIESLLKNGKGEVYWKYDDAFVKDKSNEAGYFVNHFIDKWSYYETSVVITSELKNHPKKINFVGASMNVSQAKYAGKLLEKLSESDIAKTAVILSDESLLQPVLDSLPANIKDVNVTMGIPLASTMLFSLSEFLMNLLSQKKKKSIYHAHILPILNHPYIKLLDQENIEKTIQKINKDNIIGVEPQFISEATNNELLKKIINELASPSEKEILSQISKIIDWLYQNLLTQDVLSLSEKEVFLKLQTTILRLDDILKTTAELKVSAETIQKLYRQIIYSTKLPLEGEPLVGLQIMGALEARVLDFENIIILGVNEGVFPSTSYRSTLVPHSVRVAFGLPTFKTSEIIYANLFYTLIQRTKNLDITHNIESVAGKMGEKSRYIIQLQMLTDSMREYISLSENTFSFEIQSKLDKDDNVGNEIKITKNEEILNFLKNRFSIESEYGLSPSALITYLTCSLRFYFQYILKLREKEEVEEEFQAVDIGRVIHETLESLYEGYTDVTVSDISSLLKKSDSEVEKILIKNSHNFKKEGFNNLVISAIQKYVKITLKEDLKEAPFAIIGIEKNVESEFLFSGVSIKMKGNIDHLRLKNEVIEVIDYKTGGVPKSKFEIHKLIEEIEEKPSDFKHQFQILIYGLLYLKENSHSAIITKLFYPKDGKYKNSEILTLGSLLEFENKLGEIINKIFDLKIPFEQVKDQNKCLFCAYKEICNRTPKTNA